MPVVLHETFGSPYCMSVKLLAKLIDLDLQCVPVNMAEREYLSPAYMELNPFHTVPTLNDNGFIVFESRAIMCYLLNRYAPDSELYPKDLQKRALVDAMLDFDCGTLAVCQGLRIFSFISSGKDLPEAYLERSKDSLKCLNTLLGKRKYAAGDWLSIADIAIVHTLGYAEAFEDDMSGYPCVQLYIKQVRTDLGAAYSEGSAKEFVFLKSFVKSKKGT